MLTIIGDPLKYLSYPFSLRNITSKKNKIKLNDCNENTTNEGDMITLIE